MKKILFILVLFFLSIFISNLMAQDVIKSRSNFKVDVDLARFYGDSTLVYVELYYGISENIFTYAFDSGKYKGFVNCRLEIKSANTLVARKEWIVPSVLEDKNRLMTPQTLLGLQTIELPVGDYTFTLISYDSLDTAHRDSTLIALPITKYPTDKEFLSDIEFCSSIQSSANKEKIFYKNTLEVLPNPSRMYGTGMPIMCYYFTAYNLVSPINQSDVIVRASVFDALGREIMKKDKIKARKNNASVEIGSMNLSALKTGTYLFKVSIIDSQNVVFAESEKKFFVFKYGSIPDSSMTAVSMSELESKYSVMTEEEINRLFEYAHYIASAAEISQFEQLADLKAKQKFLVEFWKRRSAASPGGINDETYYQRIKQATDQFTSGFRDGWKTDRGRVFVLYGPYDEIERYPSSSESNPYEIWHYNNIQGGVEFVFVDREGMGNFVLVHSTHRNELHEEQWYERYALKMR